VTITSQHQMSVPLFPAFDARGDAAVLPVEVVLPGRAMQVVLMEFMLKAPGTKRLKL